MCAKIRDILLIERTSMSQKPTLIRETFPVGPLQCNCTIIGDPVTKKAIVVDPGAIMS